MDLRTRYRGSVLGIAWSLLHPLAMTGILCLAFSQVFDVSLQTYAPFLMVGLTLWSFLVTTANGGSQCFFHGETYIRQRPLPLAIYPHDPKFDAVDALTAGFPAGTVSGAPKIRAMEIIDELEPQRRSFYAGCVGYFSANGSMDTCITLRTALVKDGKIYAQAGGGIVADSSAEGEFEESVNKAKAIMRAAEEAIKFA